MSLTLGARGSSGWAASNPRKREKSCQTRNGEQTARRCTVMYIEDEASSRDNVSREFRALSFPLDKRVDLSYNYYKMRELLNKTGMKKTPQRLAILEFLKGNTSHPSAEDIYAAVVVKYPSMSFATVYNTLNKLREHRSLLELTIEPGRKRFDPNPAPHNHMICTKCGRIEDIHESFSLELPRDAMLGFRLTGTHVDFYGVCPSCDENDTTKGGPICA